MIGFSNIWMLAALAGIGLPVIIHVMTRPRPRPVSLPTYRFLVEAAAGRQRLHKLRTFIVLAARTLAVLMLVLLFAGPFIRNASVASPAQASKKTVVIIDATLSMKAVSGGVSLFDRAKAEASELLRGLESGTKAGVIFIRKKPEAVLPVLSGNIPALIERIQSAVPGLTSGNPVDALSLAQQMLDGPGTLYLFSDFQKSAFKTATLNADRDLRIILRPVTDTDIDNIAVTDIHTDPPDPIAGQPIEIRCTVFNCTPRPRQAPVTLSCLGESYSRVIQLPPYASAAAGFTLSPGKPGLFTGRVTLGVNDALMDDNTRFFKLRVQTESIVLIMSDHDAENTASPVFYVSTAVSPYADRSGIRAITRHGQDADIHVLDTADTFILCPPLVLTEKTASAIAARVKQGARLVCLIDGPGAGNVINALDRGSGGAIRPPFHLHAYTDWPVQKDVGLTDIDYTRDPLKIFSGAGNGDLSALRFDQRYAATPIESDRHDIRASFPDGSAALSVSNAGNGVAVFINLPLDRGDGNLVSSPLFPALLHECMRLTGSADRARSTYPGTVMEMMWPQIPDADDAGTGVTGPDGRTRDHTLVALGNHMRLSVSGVDTPGIYTVHVGEKTTRYGVVNIDPKESDTRIMPAGSIAFSDESGNPVRTIVAGTAGELVSHPVKNLWPLAGILLAIFLAIEMLVLALWRTKNGGLLRVRHE